jgi:dihydropteroate synthase
VIPVVESLARRVGDTQISIDTSKAAVARAAIAAGASLVNDISALRADPEMASIVAGSGADCCLMHMLGEPRTMQRVGGPRYKDVVDDVRAFLEQRMVFAVGEGIAEDRILLDPGIGFGKTVAHNLALLRRLDEIVALGRPVVVGTSRKSFLGRIAAAGRGGGGAGVADESGAQAARDAAERLPGTIATNVMALERGAGVFRVHDVAEVGGALAVAAATLSGKWTATPTTS